MGRPTDSGEGKQTTNFADIEDHQSLIPFTSRDSSQRTSPRFINFSLLDFDLQISTKPKEKRSKRKRINEPSEKEANDHINSGNMLKKMITQIRLLQ